MSSNYLRITSDSSGIMGIGTSASYPLPDAALMYCWPNPGCTSRIVAMVNGTAYGYSAAATTTPLTAVGSGLGAYLEITKSIVPGVLLTAHYEIVDNPQTGLDPDTAMMKFTYSNMGTAPVTLGLRVEIDTYVNGNDGANISITNGASTVPVDTLYTQNAGNLPSQWWDYDVAPPATPHLTGYGALYNNGYGTTATEPDAFEVAYWPTVSGATQWTAGSLGTPITDSAVVYWWTGTGTNSHGNIVLNPGQSTSFIAYYGLSEMALGVTPTATSTPTATPSVSPTSTAAITSATPTCVPQVWPDPFNLKFAKDGRLKIGCVTPGSQVTLYTLSGEVVWSTQQSSYQYGSPYTAVWNGQNQNGVPVSPGVYYYVIQEGSQVTQRGKFLVIGGP